MNNIDEKITGIHGNDAEQLDVIFSTSPRILTEAAAGCGKTRTMVSKIAYLLANELIPSPKKILALTFSINAAYKIKKDVSTFLPELLDSPFTTGLRVAEKIYISNYHGFCRRLLKLYGKALHPSLSNIDLLIVFDDSYVSRIQQSVSGITVTSATILADFAQQLKNADSSYLSKNLERYCKVIIEDCLPSGRISFNAILALSIKLLKENKEIKKFYQTYFSTIIIDEFQDTNKLSIWLIHLLISEKTNIYVFGDSLQRIYNFIGAVENVLEIFAEKFELETFRLSQNHRYAGNKEMLLLDKNIRQIAKVPKAPFIGEEVRVELSNYSTQDEEANAVITKAKQLLDKYQESKVAILVRQRGPNTDEIIRTLDELEVSYFFGLFSDDDKDYVHFHDVAQIEFTNLLQAESRLTRNLGAKHIERMHDRFPETLNPAIKAQHLLLSVFWKRLFTEFRTYPDEVKMNVILDTFQHRGLKQFIEFLDSKLILSTVHAAKGLEWDYVIMPDMEENSFPNAPGLCRNGTCPSRSSCRLEINESNERHFLEELSVFYVGVTRAKRGLFFTASDFDVNGARRNVSCLLNLPGIKYLSKELPTT